jgi:hypothetical protein
MESRKSTIDLPDAKVELDLDLNLYVLWVPVFVSPNERECNEVMETCHPRHAEICDVAEDL